MARLGRSFLGGVIACGIGVSACSKRVPAPGPPETWANSLGMHFVPVEGTPVLFSVYETRDAEFQAFVKETGSEWIPPDAETGGEYPAANVTWDDAVAFCQWLTNREHAAGTLASTRRYRLPTDAEWSLAAGLEEETSGTPAEKGAASLLRYVWGPSWPPPAKTGNFAGEEAPVDKTEPDLFIAGYNDGYPRLAPVGKFTANRFGLCDLAGNVVEFCDDWFDASHRGRVARGGSWMSGDARTLAATHRAEIPPRAGLDVTGFRCVLER
jgi:formylglycine-generating enzyme required for sulfatase activity